MEEILRIFPPYLAKRLSEEIRDWGELEEIRIRIMSPVEIVYSQFSFMLHHVIPTTDDGIFILNQLSEHSIYRLEDELRQGYITIEGGHRVGISGKVNTEQGSVKAIRHLAFFNFRIAKQIKGVAKPFVPSLFRGQYLNTLLIGPPRCGKTTFLRDFIRIISDGEEPFPAKKVAVIDERSEIAACKNGIPQHDVGVRTDVMDACPKAEGMMMMIRSMSPDVMVVDEIGSKEDVQALMEALHAGITVICSVHGKDVAEIRKRPSLAPLFHANAFQRYVTFSTEPRPGTVQSIVDENNQSKNVRGRRNEVDRSPSLTVRHNIRRF
ncbi:stage III sporulation protein AA [Salirhabdus salicampi]|uniref:stage III sporulation protein AA n=1 Tax=Salirhabdus salicampi TaxID=476102 RepID=UPI0020C28C94|nr:stage III sporulation protein AA [Salirhabdus salicampi]MCP8616827.1 stage III sporulation protein AA [Salirhabdus salicampi]